MEAKDNSKQAVNQIKILATSKAASAKYDSDTYSRVPHKKKSSTGVLLACNKKGKKPPKHKGYQC